MSSSITSITLDNTTSTPASNIYHTSGNTFTVNPNNASTYFSTFYTTPVREQELEKALEEVVESSLALSLTSKNELVRKAAERVVTRIRYEEALEKAKELLPKDVLDILGLK